MRRHVYTENDARIGLTVALRANGTVNSSIAIDTTGYRTAMLVAVTGTITDGTHALKLQDSDDGSTNWVDVADTVGSVSLISTSDDTTQESGAHNFRRFLRVVATTSGAATGGTFGAVVILGTPRRTPVTH